MNEEKYKEKLDWSKLKEDVILIILQVLMMPRFCQEKIVQKTELKMNGLFDFQINPPYNSPLGFKFQT